MSLDPKRNERMIDFTAEAVPEDGIGAALRSTGAGAGAGARASSAPAVGGAGAASAGAGRPTRGDIDESKTTAPEASEDQSIVAGKPAAKSYPFTLDPFQRRAVECLERDESVLVSAHTSAGKTVSCRCCNRVAASSSAARL